MKTFKYISSFILFFILLTACEDYLTENNQSGITADPFYTTEEGVEALVNSCYTPLRLWYGKEGGATLTELGTDLFIRGGDCKHPELSMYDNINFNGQSPIIKEYWNWFYAALNFCNTALNYLGEDSPLNAATTELRRGEVYFLRAFYLWHITEIWGDVAFSTEESIGVITTAERRPVSEFYQQILEDLDHAIPLLDGRISHDGGRIIKPAAEAFKARVLLTRASADYISGGDQSSDYQQAAQLAKKVISDYSFVLAEDYAAMWDMDNSEGSSNGEVIFYCNYTNDYTLGGYDLDDYDGNSTANAFRKDAGNHLHLMYCPRYDFHPGMDIDLSGIGYQRYATNKRLVDLYDEEIDQRYYGTFREAWFCNNTSVGDYPDMQIGDTALVFTKKVVSAAERQRVATRYRLLDATDLFDAEGGLTDNRNFVQMNKHSDPTRPTAMDVRSSRDAFIIRIAEMYLIVAEASMQSGSMSDAVDYMNQLRTRRAYAGKEDQMRITQADMNIDFILEERARELVGENLRWFDLKRTGKLIEYVKKYNTDAKNNIQDYHVLRPIPQTQLDAVSNKDEFKQNPGYN